MGAPAGLMLTTSSREVERALNPHDIDDWVGRLLAEGVPCGPVLDYARVFDALHMATRKMVDEVEHPVEGRVRTLGIPVKLSETPATVRRAPPLLGEHAAEVFSAIAVNRSPWGDS